jgi:Raf kinase inhibitor-like YbhB/YbcL family protein
MFASILMRCVCLAPLLGAAAIGLSGAAERAAKEERSMTMTVTSAAFAQQAAIPAKHTCEGQDSSPPLTWSGVPSGTRSLVLILDDPDAPDPAAPRMTWVHWVLYNLAPDAGGIAEGAKVLPAGSREGLNDWQRTGYGGPCPPIGRHRYFFKLYALDTVLPDLGRAGKAKVESAMKGHVIAQAELVGTYQKQRP